eukprot:scaffold340_cov148-Skeletonema_menzelii.AAC.1
MAHERSGPPIPGPKVKAIADKCRCGCVSFGYASDNAARINATTCAWWCQLVSLGRNPHPAGLTYVLRGLDKDADTAFVGGSFDSEDDSLAVGVRFVEVCEVGWWRDGQVVERGYWAGRVGGCGGGRDGCHGS